MARSKALQSTLIPIPLDEGMDGGTDPLIAGKSPVRLENCQWSRAGAISKRSGRERSSGAFSGAHTIMGVDGGLVAMGGGEVKRWTVDAGWVDRTSSRPLYTTDVNHTVVGGRANACDIASLDDYYVTAVGDAGSITIQVRESATNELVLSSSASSSDFTSVRLVRASGTKAILYYYTSDVATTISCLEITPTAIGSLSTISITAPGTSTYRYFDAVWVDGGGVGDYAVLVYHDDTAEEILATFLPDGLPAGAPAEQTIATGSTYGFMCSCAEYSAVSSVAFYWTDVGVSPSSIRFSVWETATPSETVASTQITTVTASTYEDDRPRMMAPLKKKSLNQNPFLCYTMQRLTGASLTGHGRPESSVQTPITGSLENSYLYGKPIHLSSAGNAIVAPMYCRSWDTTEQQTSSDAVYLCISTGDDAFPEYPICKVADGLSIPHVSQDWDGEIVEDDLLGAPNVVEIEGDVAFLYTRRIGEGTKSFVTSVCRVTLDASSFQHATHDGSVFVGSGVPLVVSGGDAVFEHGFLRQPDPIYAELASGGNLTANQSYSYVYTFERVDSRGRRWQSVPSVIEASITTDASNTSADLSGVTHAPYVNGAADAVFWRRREGRAFRRVGRAVSSADGLRLLTGEDLEDSLAEGSEVIYTDAGILEAVSPPPHTATAVWDGRHFCSDSENRRTIIRYSKQATPARPFEHNEFLRIELPELGGEVVALGQTLDKLIVLKETAIYAIQGEGKTRIGSGNGYDEPYLISGAVGCSNARSVVNIPGGLMFLGTDGSVWMLSDGLELSNPGEASRYYTDTYNVVRGVVLPGGHVAVWFTSDGPALVYDWLRRKWSLWTGHEAVDAAAVGSDLYWLDSSGYIWYEDTSEYDDNGSYVSMLVETGWIHIPLIGGRGHAREIVLVGYFHENCDLVVKAQYDGDPVWSTPLQYDLADLEPFDRSAYYGDGLTSTYLHQAMVLKVYLDRREISSLRLSISDTQADGGPVNTEGFSLVAVAVSVAARPGSMRIGSDRKVGA